MTELTRMAKALEEIAEHLNYMSQEARNSTRVEVCGIDVELTDEGLENLIEKGRSLAGDEATEGAKRFLL